MCVRNVLEWVLDLQIFGSSIIFFSNVFALAFVSPIVTSNGLTKGLKLHSYIWLNTKKNI